MKRLTEKQNGEYILYFNEENSLYVTTVSIDNSLSDFRTKDTPRITSVTGTSINKLGELEDVLEKWHIEDLDKFIEEQIAKKIELNDVCWKLEQELVELKEKAIVPKYKTGESQNSKSNRKKKRKC